MEKKKKLLDRGIYFYGCAFFIPVFCLLGICIVMGITPFGKESFLIADMQKQYVDYLSYYKTIFRGENDIFYTFGKCLGGDMIGFFTYYLMSPFNLFFLLLKDSLLPAGITFLIVGKAGLCGSTMAYYLKKRFGTGNRAEIFLFSTSYAMMGYLSVNSFNIMWQDALVLFPCVLYGIEKILAGRKPYTYLAAMFGVLFTNYYIGYMICIACVLYLGYRLLACGRVEALSRKLWRFCYASLLAGGLCAVILLPTFLTLQGSLKDGADLGVGVTLPNLRPIRVFSKAFSMVHSEDELMNGMPVIFCGILIIVLTLLFFCNKAIPKRERIAAGCLLSVLMASFCFARVDYAWHAFMEPSGYHYRYSFLFSFFAIVFSWQGFLHIKEGTDKKRLLIAGGIFTVLLLFLFRHTFAYLSVQKILPDVALFYGMLFLLYRIKKAENARIWILLLAVLQVGNLTLNSVYTYMKNRNTSYCSAEEYVQAVERIRPVTESVKSRDEGLYRMENLEKRNNNDSMHFSYAGLTHYSSNEKNFVLKFLEKMGLNYNRLYVEYGNGTTQTIDSLLGIKYLLGSENTINKPYPAAWTEGELTVYRNPYALPLGFLAKEEILSVDMKEENPFALQAAMYGKAAGKEESVFKDVKQTAQKTENAETVREGTLSRLKRINDEIPIRVSFELETTAAGRVFAYMTADQESQNAEIYVNGQFLCGYLNCSNWKILNLGDYKSGERLTVTVQLSGEELRLGQAYFVTEDEEVLAEDFRLLQKEPVYVERKSSSRLLAETENKEKKLLVFSIPYEEDWRITVDGKRTGAVKAYDTLLAIPLEAGTHRISLRYVPKGMEAGAVISAVCAVITAGLFICGRKERKREERHEKQRTV